MEIMLRCEVPDRPGALAALAGAIGTAGGDIEAVDVVETAEGVALDDLLVRVDPKGLRHLVDTVTAVDGVTLVHAAPSRGAPGDAITRLAVGLEALLNGAMTPDHALTTLVGGLLRASGAEVCARDEAPRADAKLLVLDLGEQRLVVRREYRFTTTERDRADAIIRVCREAAATRR